MNWGTTTNNNLVYHDFGLQTPQQYTETDGRIEYGRAYHATTLAQGVTYATCADEACRSMFATNGKLDGSQDINFREVNNKWPVMALSIALGSITQTDQPLVFVLGHSRDPVVEYQRTNEAPETRSLFFHTLFDKIEDAVSVLNPSNTAVPHRSTILSPACLVHPGLPERSPSSQSIR